MLFEWMLIITINNRILLLTYTQHRKAFSLIQIRINHLIVHEEGCFGRGGESSTKSLILHDFVLELNINNLLLQFCNEFLSSIFISMMIPAPLIQTNGCQIIHTYIQLCTHICLATQP